VKLKYGRAKRGFKKQIDLNQTQMCQNSGGGRGGGGKKNKTGKEINIFAVNNNSGITTGAPGLGRGTVDLHRMKFRRWIGRERFTFTMPNSS